MIPIAAMFIVILYFDIRYLKKNKRTPRTYLKFLILWSVLLTAVEMDYAVKDRWSYGMALTSLFEPVEKILFLEDRSSD